MICQAKPFQFFHDWGKWEYSTRIRDLDSVDFYGRTPDYRVKDEYRVRVCARCGKRQLKIETSVWVPRTS